MTGMKKIKYLWSYDLWRKVLDVVYVGDTEQADILEDASMFR